MARGRIHLARIFFFAQIVIKHCNSWLKTDVNTDELKFLFIWIYIHYFHFMLLWWSYTDSSISTELKALGEIYLLKGVFPFNIIFVLSFKVKLSTHCLLWYLNKLMNICTKKKWERPGKGHLVLFLPFLFPSGHHVNVKFIWEAAVKWCGLLPSLSAVPVKGGRLDLWHFSGPFLKLTSW